MNKIITVALVAGGLLLLDSPEAAAHKEVRTVYPPSTYYRVATPRAKHMPNWLKRNRSFRNWYKHTRLRKNRRLAWYQLFEIYRWERFDRMKHRRGGRHAHTHDYYRDDVRSERRRRARRRS